jgi:hypothetical protein
MSGDSKWSGFKYAMCSESMAELSWQEQYRIVSNAGYKGIEVAAWIFVKESVEEIAKQVNHPAIQIVFDFSAGGRKIAEESMSVFKQIEGELL